jgi:hypothetical protein
LRKLLANPLEQKIAVDGFYESLLTNKFFVDTIGLAVCKFPGEDILYKAMLFFVLPLWRHIAVWVKAPACFFYSFWVKRLKNVPVFVCVVYNLCKPGSSASPSTGDEYGVS